LNAETVAAPGKGQNLVMVRLLIRSVGCFELATVKRRYGHSGEVPSFQVVALLGFV
jgi:hypothetical protein